MFDKNNPRLAHTLFALGELYRATERYVEAEPVFKETISIQENAFGPYHPLLAISLNNLAVIYEKTSRYQEAIPLYRRSIEMHKVVHGVEHPELIYPLTNLAQLHADVGEYDDALRYAGEAKQIIENRLLVNKELQSEKPNYRPSLIIF